MTTTQVYTALKTKSPPKIYRVAKDIELSAITKSLQDILTEHFTAISKDQELKESFLNLVSLVYLVNRKEEGTLEAIYTKAFLKRLQDLDEPEY